MITFDIEEERAFLEKLRQQDEPSWQEVYLNAVLPVLRSSTRNGVSYYKIMKDRDLDELTLYGMLYEEMLYYKALEKCDVRCPVFFWMQIYVRKLILGYCKKNDTPVSENDNDNVSISDNSEVWEVVEKSFSQLWRENPMRAYVYQLKRYYELPSKQIGTMLNLTEDNVNQIYARSKKDMAELLEKMAGGVL